LAKNFNMAAFPFPVTFRICNILEVALLTDRSFPLLRVAAARALVVGRQGRTGIVADPQEQGKGARTLFQAGATGLRFSGTPAQPDGKIEKTIATFGLNR
jgi:hypothetical protein